MPSPSTKSHSLSHGETAPIYHPPTSGALSLVPPVWIPYLELARVDRPTGIYHFYFPHLFGTLFAACIRGDITLHDTVITNIVLFGGTIFFRAAACSWNDFVDQDYDRQVLRCRLRPLARGALTSYQGHCVTIGTALVALGFLATLPEKCWMVSVPSILLSILYPFAKRFTDFPQALLGVQLAIGFFVGIGAIVKSTSPDYYRQLDINEMVGSQYTFASCAFYLSNVCWTIVHDTIYAQQDVRDDAKAGIHSMAVHFRGRVKPLMLITACLQVAFLAASGIWAGFGRGYMAVSCGFTMVSLIYMLQSMDLDDPAECAWFFKSGQWFVNLGTAGGLILEYLMIV